MADSSIILQDESVQARFWESVDRRAPNECWPWRAVMRRGGYGVFTSNRVQYRAPRIALLLATGNPGSGLCALHSCDNPPCVNPAHLRWGTIAENNQDKVQRGRVNRWHGRRAGSANINAKLTDSDVLQIRSSQEPQTALAARYGITQGAISRIKSRSSWSHIKEAIS